MRENPYKSPESWETAEWREAPVLHRGGRWLFVFRWVGLLLIGELATAPAGVGFWLMYQDGWSLLGLVISLGLGFVGIVCFVMAIVVAVRDELEYWRSRRR